jgi:hypothetical protein
MNRVFRFLEPLVLVAGVICVSYAVQAFARSTHKYMPTRMEVTSSRTAYHDCEFVIGDFVASKHGGLHCQSPPAGSYIRAWRSGTLLYFAADDGRGPKERWHLAAKGAR